jgi:hypothetical protein
LIDTTSVVKNTIRFPTYSYFLGYLDFQEEPMRSKIRNSLFRLARQDVIDFLDEHEAELLEIFREELQAVDDSIPEENFFIDIRMVALGEELMISVLRALKRFMREV